MQLPNKTVSGSVAAVAAKAEGLVRSALAGARDASPMPMSVPACPTQHPERTIQGLHSVLQAGTHGALHTRPARLQEVVCKDWRRDHRLVRISVDSRFGAHWAIGCSRAALTGCAKASPHLEAGIEIARLSQVHQPHRRKCARDGAGRRLGREGLRFAALLGGGGSARRRRGLSLARGVLLPTPGAVFPTATAPAGLTPPCPRHGEDPAPLLTQPPSTTNPCSQRQVAAASRPRSECTGTTAVTPIAAAPLNRGQGLAGEAAGGRDAWCNQRGGGKGGGRAGGGAGAEGKCCAAVGGGPPGAAAEKGGEGHYVGKPRKMGEGARTAAPPPSREPGWAETQDGVTEDGKGRGSSTLDGGCYPGLCLSLSLSLSLSPGRGCSLFALM